MRWFSVVTVATSFLIQSLWQKLQKKKCHFLMTRSYFLPVFQLIVETDSKWLASLHTFVYTDGELTDLTQWSGQVLKRENRKKKMGSCSLSCLDKMHKLSRRRRWGQKNERLHIDNSLLQYWVHSKEAARQVSYRRFSAWQACSVFGSLWEERWGWYIPRCWGWWDPHVMSTFGQS